MTEGGVACRRRFPDGAHRATRSCLRHEGCAACAVDALPPMSGINGDIEGRGLSRRDAPGREAMEPPGRRAGTAPGQRQKFLGPLRDERALVRRTVGRFAGAARARNVEGARMESGKRLGRHGSMAGGEPWAGAALTGRT